MTRALGAGSTHDDFRGPTMEGQHTHTEDTPPEGSSSVTSSLLSLVFEQSGEGIIFVNTQGQVRLFNAEAERQHGVTRQTAMATGWALNLPLYSDEDDRALALEEMPIFRALQGERVDRVRWRVRRPDGDVRMLSGTAAPLIARDGALLGAVLLTRDETEQSALEKALRAEEVAFHRVMASGLMGLLLSDDAGRIVDANDAFLDLIGATTHDLAEGKLTWDRITPHEEHGLDVHTAEELGERGVTGQFEREFIRLDGRRVPVLMGSAAIEEKQRTITFVLDVSERRRAEHSLELLSEMSRLLADAFDEPERRFPQIAGLATGALFDLCQIDIVRGAENAGIRLERTGASHRDPFVSSRLKEVLGDAPGSLQKYVASLGKSCQFHDLRTANSHPGDPDATQLRSYHSLGLRTLLFAPMRAHGQTLGVVTMGRGRAGGTTEDLSLVEELARRLAVALDNAQLVARAQAATHAKQHALEEARHAEWWARYLADASRLFSASLDTQSSLDHLTRLAVPTLADFCAVDMLEEDGRLQRRSIAHVNPERVSEAWEFSRRFPTDLNRDTGLAKVVRTRKSEVIFEVNREEFARAVPDPEFGRWLERLGIESYLLVPLVARDRTLGVLLLVYARESRRRFTESDVRRAEDFAQRAALALDNSILYRQSQEAIRVRDDFLSVASHELKTPLTPLHLKVESLLRSATRESPTCPPREALESMGRQVRRLSTLIDGLLDVSRIRSGRLDLQWETFDLVPVVQEVIQRFEAQAAQAGSRIELHAPTPVVGHWDRLRIEQVVTNLFTNALKYGAGEEVSFSVRRDGAKAVLEVRDRGIGVAGEDVKRIFERFERAVSERHYGGLGLGLYISRQIVDALGGEISVESEPGQGATFRVVLPLPPEHAQQ